jgi:hypothetical protein
MQCVYVYVCVCVCVSVCVCVVQGSSVQNSEFALEHLNELDSVRRVQIDLVTVPTSLGHLTIRICGLNPTFTMDVYPRLVLFLHFFLPCECRVSNLFSLACDEEEVN